MLKRIFDIFLSFFGLIILLIPLLFLCLLIRIKLGEPIFFFQVRPGKNEKNFKMVKLRSMISAYDQFGNSLPDEQRLTKFGKFLRTTSLDELPGLWNVFIGNMSLVGPRPLLVEYLPLYSKEQARRHGVKPGITGWAQINGRNAISWEEKFKLDVWYVDNQSFWLDIKILFLTVKKVFIKADINADGEATMHKFTGTSHE